MVGELVARGVRLLFVYSGDYGRFYAERPRSRSRFPASARDGAVRVVCLPESNHTFGLLSHQQQLFRAVCEWAASLVVRP